MIDRLSWSKIKFNCLTIGTILAKLNKILIVSYGGQTVRKRLFFATALALCIGLVVMPYMAFAAQSDTTKTAAPEGAAKISCPMSKAGAAPKCITDGKASGEATKGGCPMGKMTSATATDATKGGCPMGKMTQASTTTDPATTTASAKCDPTMCGPTGKCADLTLAITGMTCTSCEQKITEALMSDKGVLKVVSIDYKTGKAVVCYDPAKIEQGKLAALVVGSGYQAEVVPASATSVASTGKGACCRSGSAKCVIKADTKTDDKAGSH